MTGHKKTKRRIKKAARSPRAIARAARKKRAAAIQLNKVIGRAKRAVKALSKNRLKAERQEARSWGRGRKK